MKCPMLTMYATTFKLPEEYKDRDCLMQECAWWDDYRQGQCAIKKFFNSVGYISSALQKFVDRN